MSTKPARTCQHVVDDENAVVCGAKLHRGTKTGLCAKHSRQVQAVERTKTPELPKEGLTIRGNEAELTKAVARDVRGIEDLIEMCNIDQTVWHIKEYKCKKWSVPMRPVEGAPLGTPPTIVDVYYVDAKMVRKVTIIDARNEIESLLEDAKKAVPARKPAAAGRPEGVMLELAVPDLHMGKLAWGKETGDRDYDIGIAEAEFLKALDTLLERNAHLPIAEVLFVLGNDLLNVDNRSSQTTAGTPQDQDTRYQKTFGVTRQMLTRAIERVKQLAPVRVPVVPGNHDTLSAWQMGDSLSCYFHRTPGVTIDNEPTARKYVEFGKVMLLFTHGDKGKHGSYPLLMAQERPEMWARTRHREVHTGHLHQTRTQEFMGVRVRISPALCPPDAWHSEKHFVGNLRGAESFAWDRHEGLIATAHYTVQ